MYLMKQHILRVTFQVQYLLSGPKVKYVTDEPVDVEI